MQVIKYICYKKTDFLDKGEIIPVYINVAQDWSKHEGAKITALGVTPDTLASDDFKELKIMPLSDYRKLKLKEIDEKRR